MLKSGLIFAAAMLVLGGILAFIFPLCVPCLALLAGAGAGYLAGVFERPAGTQLAARTGAIAGAIGGAGALLGHLVGGLATAVFVGPQAASEFARSLGLPGQIEGQAGVTGYYFGATAFACCFGLVEVALMAGLGALGGLLWAQISARGAGSPPPLTNLPA